MCNIAGYAGAKQAAPVLLEMLRRQEYYDGNMCTGIATLHEGKLYYRKVNVDVDTFIRETDVLSLPGTVGMAHTRPSRNPELPTLHPFISMDKKTALVTNGTTPVTKYMSMYNGVADMLDREGFIFATESKTPARPGSPRLSKNGHGVFYGEIRVFLFEKYLREGKSPENALAAACADNYGEHVTVLVSEALPGSILVHRITRPMTAVTEKGETYISTSRFGLPEELRDKAFDLPVLHTCKVTANGVTVTGSTVNVEPVSAMTPYTYHEGYRRLEALLKSDKAPLYFDELEFAVDEMRDLWEGDHTFVQHARLVYDLLYQFDKEGRLRREVRVQDCPNGTRKRYYFSLEG